MLWKLYQYSRCWVYLLFLFSSSPSKWRASLGHRIAWKIGILNSHTVLLLWGTAHVAEKAEAEWVRSVWGSGAEPAETWQKTKGFSVDSQKCAGLERRRSSARWLLGPQACVNTECLLCNHASTTACAVLLVGQLFLLLLSSRSSYFITFYEDRLAGRRTALLLHNTALRKSKKRQGGGDCEMSKRGKVRFISHETQQLLPADFGPRGLPGVVNLTTHSRAFMSACWNLSKACLASPLVSSGQGLCLCLWQFGVHVGGLQSWWIYCASWLQYHCFTCQVYRSNTGKAIADALKAWLKNHNPGHNCWRNREKIG